MPSYTLSTYLQVRHPDLDLVDLLPPVEVLMGFISFVTDSAYQMPACKAVLMDEVTRSRRVTVMRWN